MYTILLTEDKKLEHLLETNFREDCRIWVAKDIPDLLKKLTTESADIVLVDLDLPEYRRAESVGQLQHFAQTGSVLFLADREFFDSSHPMTAIPAADYLLKPFRALDLVLAMADIMYFRGKRQQSEEDSVRMRLVRDKIEGYIRAHYAQDLSMQGVAQVMNYSETHFCRLFKQCFNVNFSAYLNDFRIRQAKQMLLDTNYTAKEVALACGYQDNSYFIRVFKRVTGMTPVDYRIHARNNVRK